MSDTTQKSEEDVASFIAQLEIIGGEGFSEPTDGETYTMLRRRLEGAFLNQGAVDVLDAHYRQALRSENPSVSEGLRRFFDNILSRDSPSSLFENDADPFTFSLACEVSVKAGHSLESVDSTEPLRMRLASSLGISPSRIAAYPHTVIPDQYPHSISELVVRVFLARQGSNEGYAQPSNSALPNSDTTTMMRVFLVTISVDRDTSTVNRYLEMRANELGDSVSLPYTVDGKSFDAQVTCVELGAPYGTLPAYAFVAERNYVEDVIDEVLDSGRAPASVTVKFEASSFEVDSSPEVERSIDSRQEMVLVMDIADELTGEVLSRVPLMPAYDAAFAFDQLVTAVSGKGISKIQVCGTPVLVSSD